MTATRPDHRHTGRHEHDGAATADLWQEFEDIRLERTRRAEQALLRQLCGEDAGPHRHEGGLLDQIVSEALDDNDSWYGDDEPADADMLLARLDALACRRRMS
jgi:hypothetical protein